MPQFSPARYCLAWYRVKKFSPNQEVKDKSKPNTIVYRLVFFIFNTMPNLWSTSMSNCFMECLIQGWIFYILKGYFSPSKSAQWMSNWMSYWMSNWMSNYLNNLMSNWISNWMSNWMSNRMFNRMSNCIPNSHYPYVLKI